MDKRIIIVLTALLALIPVRAWACGDDGERPCGGSCNWYVKGTCPFCIPWCSRDPYFCHDGNELKTEVVGVLTGEFVEVQVCRKSAAPKRVSVAQAVAGGCRTAAEVSSVVSSTLGRGDLGTKTRAKLGEFRVTGDWVTKVLVTDPDTWGYRATNIPSEEQKLTAGNLASKAERRLSKLTGPQVTEFWRSNGPQVSINQQDSLTLSLQMLATASSDEPPSQFSSVALDFGVASRFGDIVYRFQLKPQSPVLGLRGCKLIGEVQIQPPGGTPIRNLHRYDQRKRYWERYEAGVWLKVEKDEL